MLTVTTTHHETGEAAVAARVRRGLKQIVSGLAATGVMIVSSAPLWLTIAMSLIAVWGVVMVVRALRSPLPGRGE